MMRTLCLFLTVPAVLWSTFTPHEALAEPEVSYPIVFSNPADLEALGLSIALSEVDASEKPRTPVFAKTCYWYGDGTMHFISISDEFLAQYTPRGFTHESLCLALLSQARFDPETGERLPSYIFRDDAALKSRLDELESDRLIKEEVENLIPEHFKTRGALKAAVAALRRGDATALTPLQLEVLLSEGGIMSEELPLAVPDCFKNGTPHLDCDWRYGLLSGRKLSEAAPGRYRDARRGDRPRDAGEAQEHDLQAEGGSFGVQGGDLFRMSRRTSKFPRIFRTGARRSNGLMCRQPSRAATGMRSTPSATPAQESRAPPSVWPSARETRPRWLRRRHSTVCRGAGASATRGASGPGWRRAPIVFSAHQ